MSGAKVVCVLVKQCSPELGRGGVVCNFLRRFTGEKVSWKRPVNPETKRRNNVCLQAGWESGQVQDTDMLETVRMWAFPVDPKTMKMQFTEVFMSRKGWVVARWSLPASMEIVIIPEPEEFCKETKSQRKLVAQVGFLHFDFQKLCENR